MLGELCAHTSSLQDFVQPPTTTAAAFLCYTRTVLHGESAQKVQIFITLLSGARDPAQSRSACPAGSERPSCELRRSPSSFPLGSGPTCGERPHLGPIATLSGGLILEEIRLRARASTAGLLPAIAWPWQPDFVLRPPLSQHALRPAQAIHDQHNTQQRTPSVRYARTDCLRLSLGAAEEIGQAQGSQPLPTARHPVRRSSSPGSLAFSHSEQRDTQPW